MAKVKAKVHEDHTVADAVAAITADFGNVVTNGMDFHDRFISSGIFEVDFLLSAGYLQDQILLVSGPSGSGKGLIVSKLVHEFYKKFPDLSIHWQDVETQFKTDWFTDLGIPLEEMQERGKFFLQQGVSAGESIVDTCINYANATDFGMLVLDSVSSMMTNEQTQKTVLEGFSPGGLGKSVTTLTKGLMDAIAQKRKESKPCLIVLINRKVKGIGQFATTSFVGGDSQKFWASTIVEIHRNGTEEVKVWGRQVIAETKHEYKVDKKRQKAGTTCAFHLSASEEVTGIPIGESTTEIDFLLDILKEFKFYDVHKKTYLLSDEKFKSQEEFKTWLYNKPDEVLFLKRLVIYAHRRRFDKRKGIPIDNYLIGFVSPEEEEKIEKAFIQHIQGQAMSIEKVKAKKF